MGRSNSYVLVRHAFLFVKADSHVSGRSESGPFVIDDYFS